ncbi:MAG: matrixin family metalloprotease [Chlorobi bacterium]|nr:matrixin family metalloprotease [Chlorobiota bacterium]
MTKQINGAKPHAYEHESGKTGTGTDAEVSIMYCSRPLPPEPVISADIAAGRMSAIFDLHGKWANGTVLHYYFFDRPTDGGMVHFSNGTNKFETWVGAEAQRAVVRKAFQTWKSLGIGLEFVEVKSRSAAEIRIGFMQTDGSWSYVGRQILKIGASARTMNFGWDLTGAQGMDTALHEIGHTLGLDHEHQSPFAGIVWNEAAVYAALAASPNRWSKQMTYDNIIKKVPATDVQGSNWDPDSIMEYPFEAGLIKVPTKYATGLSPKGGLSLRDITWVRHFYPAIKHAPAPLGVGNSEQLPTENGKQRDFAIKPEETRSYDIRTFGACDTVLALFEDTGTTTQYMAADDDSGNSRNAGLKVRLVEGRNYILRVRTVHTEQTAPPVVLMW